MTSCLSPYSVLSLVRHRIHVLRKSRELSVHLQGVVITVITQRQIPMVLVTKEILMLLGGGSRRAENCVSHSCSSCLAVDMPVVAHDRSWRCRMCCSSTLVDVNKFQLSVLTAG